VSVRRQKKKEQRQEERAQRMQAAAEGQISADEAARRLRQNQATRSRQSDGGTTPVSRDRRGGGGAIEAAEYLGEQTVAQIPEPERENDDLRMRVVRSDLKAEMSDRLSEIRTHVDGVKWETLKWVFGIVVTAVIAMVTLMITILEGYRLDAMRERIAVSEERIGALELQLEEGVDAPESITVEEPELDQPANDESGE